MGKVQNAFIALSVGASVVSCCGVTALAADRYMNREDEKPAQTESSNGLYLPWNLYKSDGNSSQMTGAQPTPQPTAEATTYAPVVQATQASEYCNPADPTCGGQILNTLEEARDDASQQTGWTEVGEPCSTSIEACIQDGIMLSQQRLIDLGVYDEQRNMGGAPGDWDLQRLVLNETHDGSHEIYYIFGNGQESATHRLIPSADQWKAYVNVLGGDMLPYNETTIRDHDTFVADVKSQGYTLEQLANVMVQSPDVQKQGYSLAGIMDGLEHGFLYVWAPNKIPCKDGSNSPGMLTILKTDESGTMKAYPLSFPVDDQLLDQAIDMSLPHYSN